MKFETLAIQSTRPNDANNGDVSTPIHLSTTFEREADGSYRQGFVYSRMGNPNRQALEQSLAVLENGQRGFAFSSGMSAITALFSTVSPGNHILLPHDVFFATLKLAETVFVPNGIEISTVDMTDLAAVEQALRPNTSIVWIESPSNPLLNVSDIAAIAKLARQNEAICAVDNTWPTPVLQLPLDLGADVAMHSTTKYFGGHSDVLGGALILKNDDSLADRISEYQTLTGAVASPFDCWLVARGIQTLHLRVSQQTRNAHQLADFLNKHPKIERVHYPGLASHPQHEIASRQMSGGFGAMLSVQVKESAQDAMNLAEQLELFTTATSLGGVESLIEHRKSVEGPQSPTPENLLRISVGLENIDDLVSDWTQALSQQ